MLNLGSLFSFFAPVAAPAETETSYDVLREIPVELRTQKQNRLLLADYLENEVKDKKPFNMMWYDRCGWGTHAIVGYSVSRNIERSAYRCRIMSDRWQRRFSVRKSQLPLLLAGHITAPETSMG